MNRYLDGDELYNYVKKYYGGVLSGEFTPDISVRGPYRVEHYSRAVSDWGRRRQFSRLIDTKVNNIIAIAGWWFVTQDGVNFEHPNNTGVSFVATTPICFNPDLDDD